MLRAISNRIFSAAIVALAAPSCARSVPTDPPSAPASAPSPLPSPAPPPSSAEAAAAAAAPAPAPVPAPSRAPAPDAATRSVDGPHALALTPDRPVFYVFPGATSPAGARPFRLIGHLHGICHPPSYSCGTWAGAASDVGALVCPSGNARCGDASVGPPSWEAATWDELVTTMDTDLERSVAKVEAKHRGSIQREGAILTGWSRGAFAAPVIARMHPKRWPYLVLVEANVPLTAASLRKAGVRAVALLAGEQGTEIAGERRTQAELEAAGFPAKLIVMRGVAHHYPPDMDVLMSEAFAFVLSHDNER